jgi:hypothetical protein
MEAPIRLSRKVKKKIIKVFGRGTYQGILEGILQVDKNSKTLGSHIKYTETGRKNGGRGSRFFYPNQYHPFISFKSIKNGR